MQCDLTQNESHSQYKSLYLHTQQIPKFCWIGQLKYQEFSCRLNTSCGGTKLCRQVKLCALRSVLSHGYACSSHSCRVVSRSMIPEPLLSYWSAITGLTFNLQNKRGAASSHWNWKVPPLRPDICGAQGEFTVTATSVPKQFGVTVPPSQHWPNTCLCPAQVHQQVQGGSIWQEHTAHSQGNAELSETEPRSGWSVPQERERQISAFLAWSSSILKVRKQNLFFRNAKTLFQWFLLKCSFICSGVFWEEYVFSFNS